jgi:hypothetical protein
MGIATRVWGRMLRISLFGGNSFLVFWLVKSIETPGLVLCWVSLVELLFTTRRAVAMTG